MRQTRFFNKLYKINSFIETMRREEIPFYLANPLGFNELGKILMYQVLIPQLEKIKTKKFQVKILEPFEYSKEYAPDLFEKQSLKDYKEAFLNFNKIVKRNNETLLARSKALIAILDLAGMDVDSGVAAEIRHFRDNGPVFGCKSDFRPGENFGSEGVNIEVWGDIENAKKQFNAGGIFTKLKDLIDAIKDYLDTLEE